MRPYLSMLVHASGWLQLSAMATIVWVFGGHLWPLLLTPLPLFVLAIVVALMEMRISEDLRKVRDALGEAAELK